MQNTPSPQSPSIESPADALSRILRVTLRSGEVHDLEPTMGATAHAETSGLNAMAHPNAFLACIAHRLLQRKLGARGMPSTWQEWAEGPDRPTLIEYVEVPASANFDTPPSSGSDSA